MKNNLEKEFFFNKISEELQFDIMDYFQIEDLADINNFDELTDELQEK